MEILRIPTSYSIQIQCLSDEDCKYVFKTLFELTAGIAVELEFSARGGIVQSIWRECIQLENKARSKKGGEPLSYELAPMVQPMVHPKNNLSATKSNQIKPSQTKSNQSKSISKDTDSDESDCAIVVESYGNTEINEMLNSLKLSVGCKEFKETIKAQRFTCNHIVNLYKKIGKEDFMERLRGILSDSFKRKNSNSIDYLYRELKSYIHSGDGVKVKEKSKVSSVIF